MSETNDVVICVRMVNGDVIYSFDNDIREKAIQRAITREEKFPIRFEDIITGESKLIPMHNIVSMYRVINFRELCHIRKELDTLISSVNYINIDWDDDTCSGDDNEDKYFVGKRFLRCTGTNARTRLKYLRKCIDSLSIELDKS